MEKAKSISGVQQWPYKAVAQAFEVIPRTLAQNCGAHTIRVLTSLRAKHAAGAEAFMWGIDGKAGTLVDMAQLKIWESLEVKKQTFKTAIESAAMLLRIDDIVSGISSSARQQQQAATGGGGRPEAAQPGDENSETFGDARDG